MQQCQLLMAITMATTHELLHYIETQKAIQMDRVNHNVPKHDLGSTYLHT